MATGWDSDYVFEPNPLFCQAFICLPFSRYKSPHHETGDKIIMPPSSFAEIVNLPITFPWIFKVSAHTSGRVSHCGVLEFEADEGFVHMPTWMMRNLGISEGDRVTLQEASLSKAILMKLRPHETAFTEVSNMKAVLETRLRGFTCVTRGDTIMIGHGGRDYCLDVVEVLPGDAVILVDTDCEIEFEAALDYGAPEKESGEVVREDVDDCGGQKGGERAAFVAFAGKGRRLDGKAAAAVEAEVEVEVEVEMEKEGGKMEERGGEFKAFTGKGRVLGGPYFYD